MLITFAKAIRLHLIAVGNASGLAGGRVFADYVPANAPLPYLLITVNAMRGQNTEAAPSVNAIMNVQAVTDGEEDSALAAVIADAVYADLNDATFEMDAPYTLRRCEWESAYSLSEAKDNRRFNMAGGLYRLEADS